MDFGAVDIIPFLKASMPVRFADISPYDFEDFIAELMREDGCDVERTPYSGDFGADMIVEKDGVTTVVQVKRYDASNAVGVADVNQAIGALAYYGGQQALMITTSSFTSGAIDLGKSANVMLWDWKKLREYISRVYLDGEDYYQYFQEQLQTPSHETGRFAVQFNRVEKEATALGKDALGIEFGLENTSGENLLIHLDQPTIVTRAGKQITAFSLDEELFQSGMLVSGATCEIGCYFHRARLPEIKSGDRLILRIYIRGEDQPVYIDEKMGSPRKACYVVTYLYGRESDEYVLMTTFRDHVLTNSLAGRKIIHWYYLASPQVIRYVAGENPGAKMLGRVMRIVVAIMLGIAGKWHLANPGSHEKRTITH